MHSTMKPDELQFSRTVLSKAKNYCSIGEKALKNKLNYLILPKSKLKRENLLKKDHRLMYEKYHILYH